MTPKPKAERAPQVEELHTQPLTRIKNATTTHEVSVRSDARSVIAAVTARTLKKRSTR